MTRFLALSSLAALLTVPAVQADARPAKPHPNAAVEARRSAMADFDARMTRLDALMGVPAGGRTVRARSAEAGR